MLIQELNLGWENPLRVITDVSLKYFHRFKAEAQPIKSRSLADLSGAESLLR